MAREKICGIYKITNTVNGKVYIGQSVDIYSRWSQHIRTSKVKTYRDYDGILYRALRKYGEHNFKFDILEECSVDELDDLEISYIQKFDSYAYGLNQNGYNILLGGNQGSRGRIVTDEVREKISKNRNYKSGSEHESAKKVMFDGIEYGCSSELCEKFGFNKNAIRSYLNHGNNMPVEFYVLGLRYKDEPMSNYVKQDKNACKQEVTWLDGIEFKNASECSKYCGINQGTLRSYLSKSRRMSKELYDRGLHYDKYDMSEYEYVGMNSKRDLDGIKTEIDGIVFNSVKQCADYINENQITVNAWLSKQNNMPQKYIDRNLRYCGDNETIYVSSEKSGRPKTIICDGVIYNTITSFAREIGKANTTVGDWLKGKTKMPKEYEDKGLKYYTEEVS